MRISITKSDFIEEGTRYTTEEILNLIDELHPLAEADIDRLSANGYSKKLHEELDSFRIQLRDASASRQTLNGAKKGARAGVAEAQKEGRIVLQQGIAFANVAMACRQIPIDENAQVTEEKAAQLKNQVQILSVDTGSDTAKLRTRLSALKVLLTSPEFAPPQGDEQIREAFLTKLDQVIERIGKLSETKKALKENSKDKTVATDEIHGRALANLKLLIQVGKACFKSAGDPAHAKLYNLKGLQHHRSTKPNNTQDSTPSNVSVALSASAAQDS